MKKIFGILTLASILFFSACEEIAGPAGEDGVSFLGQIFEIEGDFTDANNYALYYSFPYDFEIYETDIVMVYILWDTATGSNDQTIDVWRPLPQTRILDQGILQYNYDYTYEDVNIFLDGDIDFNYLGAADKNNQVFRIVVFPAEFANLKSVDINDLGSVMEGLKISANSIEKYNF